MRAVYVFTLGVALAACSAGASRYPSYYTQHRQVDQDQHAEKVMATAERRASVRVRDLPPPPADGPSAGDDEFRVSRTGANKRPPTTTPKPKPDRATHNTANDKSAALQEPMVVYLGYLKLRVKRLLEAVDQISAMTTKTGGYIESMTAKVVIIRIPASDFEEVMRSFGEVGEVLDKRVKALDVTRQFTDLGTRLSVARDARNRLLVLLKSIKDVKERLRILQEIKRLSEYIESVESQIQTLKNLVAFYTITIELVPVVERTNSTIHRSPFGWVRALSPHRLTIRDGKGDIGLRLPSGFFLFEDDDEYRAQSADTSMIRGGRVDNEPLGNSAFWSKAVRHEMEGRDEELLDQGQAGIVSYGVYRNKDVRPRYYIVAVHARGEDVFVLEAFYPNDAAYKSHHTAVIEALATFEVK